MAVSVTRLPGTPIVIATIGGPLNVEATRIMYALTAEAAKDIDGPVFRIVDCLRADVSFKDMARIVTEAIRRRPYSTSDPRLRPILVCGPNRMRFFPELLRTKEFGHIEIPLFDTVEEAISYARAEIAVPVPA